MGGLKMIPDINKINELNLMLHMLSRTGQIASRIFSTAIQPTLLVSLFACSCLIVNRGVRSLPVKPGTKKTTYPPKISDGQYQKHCVGCS
jgi:hypothetical protein